MEDVVATFAKVQEKVGAKLLLVGDGPEMSRIHQQVKDLQIEQEVLFLGKRDNLSELYSMSDVKLLMSEKEAFGLVLLEAMACGVPAIGTQVGGIPEIIEPGINGFLVGLGDVGAAAEAAIRVLTDGKLHEEMSAQALETASKRFSSEKILAEYEALYKRLLNKGEGQ